MWFWKRSAAVVHAPSLGEKKTIRVAGVRHKCSPICGSPVAVPVSDSNVPQFVADTGTCSQAEVLQGARDKEMVEYVLRFSISRSGALEWTPAISRATLRLPVLSLRPLLDAPAAWFAGNTQQTY